jgi:hypothetical protein
MKTPASKEVRLSHCGVDGTRAGSPDECADHGLGRPFAGDDGAGGGAYGRVPIGWDRSARIDGP